MRSKCRKYKLEHGLDLIIIDYLQLMSGSGKSSSESRQQEISDISRSLKALARELNVPVVALSQLSRAVEQRTDHHPMLSDLRESGAMKSRMPTLLCLSIEMITIIRIPRIRESRKSSSPKDETARSEPSIWSGCRIIRNLRMQREIKENICNYSEPCEIEGKSATHACINEHFSLNFIWREATSRCSVARWSGALNSMVSERVVG